MHGITCILESPYLYCNKWLPVVYLRGPGIDQLVSSNCHGLLDSDMLLSNCTAQTNKSIVLYNHILYPKKVKK